jgi:CRISPR/Cas system-associated exonuclease Cas4 (RecB family)
MSEQPPYKISAWSYSSLGTFKQCPHRYYRERIAKDIPRDPDSEAILYGTELHKAAEDYIGTGIEIPERFGYIKQWLDKLKAINGEKYVERKMGITRSNGVFGPCDFFSDDVWFRGVADLLIVDSETKTAYVVDYKTGKSAKYADPLQLELMAACVFLLHPKIEKVKGMLLYVVCRETITKEYEVKDRFKVFENLDEVLHRRTVAYETGVFNKSPNGLCRAWCPVVDCAYNGRR